jgi:signal peptidase
VPLVALLVTVWTNGWVIEAVQSGSMEPQLRSGSAVVVAPVDAAEIEAGSVIAFTDPNARGRTVVHRVRRVVEREGLVSFETQGDANATPDRELVPVRMVQGEVVRHVVGLGAAVDWVADRRNALLLVVVPAAAFGLNELVAYRQRKRGRAEALEIAALKARIVELELAASGSVEAAFPSPQGG